MGIGAEHSPVIDRDTPDLRCTAERTIVDLQGDGPLVSLGRYRYLSARDPMPPQRHATLLVLALPVRSDVEFNLDARVVNVVPGQVITIAPGTAYVTAGNAQPRGELFWLVARVGAGRGSLDEAVRQLADGSRLTWPAPEPAADQLGRALADPDDHRWTVTAARRSWCATVVFDLLRARDEEDAGPTRTVPPGVRRALAYVTRELDRPLTVHDLIASSGMSPTQFYDAFGAATGTSPKDYILRAKIARARALLADPDRKITDICYRLGFSFSQHFAEVFRRYEGMSPSEFRRVILFVP
ncbi:helix-turn-helix transcriptional regulator [Microlunatus speluncae]|uniref:helix-turn-helix transcriptional regulator n=1 Tax=Microlunatus speluncae TaxID=2594267 RepID=UPI0012661D71|nr:AraC family transcriptional regulator [Microlunatus speluncae]